MKRNIIALDEIKKQISDLKGNSVNMEINKGRNKIDTFTGVIIKVYPSVFTVETYPPNHQQIQTKNSANSTPLSNYRKIDKKQILREKNLYKRSYSNSKTFSYFDVLCGDVKITPILEAEV